MSITEVAPPGPEAGGLARKKRRSVEVGGAQVVAGRRKSLLRSLSGFEITKKKVPRKHVMHFSRQMGMFFHAGVPVLEALEAIGAEMDNKLMKSVLADMSRRLQSGETFAGAARAHPEAFPPFYLGVLGSAELTGSLDTVMLQLSSHIEREIEARRTLINGLIYPAIIILMSIVVVVVLTTFVLPRFIVFFQQLNATLPLPTRMLIDFANDIVEWWFVIAGVGGLLMAVVVLAFVTQKGRDIRDTVLLKVPVVKDLVTFSVLERFCRVLGSMLSAGVPLTEAMQVTVDATANYVYRTGIARARDAMLRGEGLVGPLTETGLFPPTARQMLRVGETAGALDEQLEVSAEYFGRELDVKIKHFTSLFEPAVIIFVGTIVGFVAIALISAMYGIYRQVNVA